MAKKSSFFGSSVTSDVFRKHIYNWLILVKIVTIGHFDVKKSQKKNQTDSETFDRLMTLSFLTFLRNHISAESINVKIGTIVHFDDKKSQKKIRTIPTFLTEL